MNARAAISARIARACSIRPISSIRARRSRVRTDIEIRDTTHLFLKQSQFVRAACANGSTATRRTGRRSCTSIANKWLDEGLHDRGITRDLEWGVPVPDDIADGKLKGKVFYVWFDAPIEYIGATKEWADANGKGDAWRDWWSASGEGRRLFRVHGQGQRAVPHGRLSRHHHGLGRAVEARRPAQGLQLAQLLRRQILDHAASAACSWTRRSRSCPPITGAIT